MLQRRKSHVHQRTWFQIHCKNGFLCWKLDYTILMINMSTKYEITFDFLVYLAGIYPSKYFPFKWLYSHNEDIFVSLACFIGIVNYIFTNARLITGTLDHFYDRDWRLNERISV